MPKEYFIAGIQPEVEAAVRAAIATLQDLGAEVREISLPHTDLALPVYYLIAPAEASANLARYDGIRYGLSEPGESLWETYRRTRGEGFGPEVKRRIMLGAYALSAGYYDAYYLKAQQVRTLIKQDFDLALAEVDVIACPTSPTTAFRIGEKADDPLSMYLADIFTLSLNLAGICGLSLPCGFDGTGLPVGLQLIAGAFAEDAAAANRLRLRASHGVARQKARAPRLERAYHWHCDNRTASNQGILHAKAIISLSRRHQTVLPEIIAIFLWTCYTQAGQETGRTIRESRPLKEKPCLIAFRAGWPLCRHPASANSSTSPRRCRTSSRWASASRTSSRRM